MILTPLRKIVLIGAGGIVLIGGFWLWMAARERDAKNLAVAEERERHSDELLAADRKREDERRIERENTAKLIEANIEMGARLERIIAASNSAAAQLRATLLAPKPVEQVVKDSQEHLGVTPRPEADDRISVTKEEFQALIAMKVEVERLTRNDTERERQVRLLEDTNRRLLDQQKGYEESLRSKDVVIAAQLETIAAYEKAAKKSGWRKFGSVAGKVGLAVLPAVTAAVILK